MIKRKTNARGKKRRQTKWSGLRKKGKVIEGGRKKKRTRDK